MNQIKQNKVRHFYYDVPDCEHEGDIQSAIYQLDKRTGGTMNNIFCDKTYSEDHEEIIACTINFVADTRYSKTLYDYGCF